MIGLIIVIGISVLYYFSRTDKFVRTISPFISLMLMAIYTFSKNPFINEIRNFWGPSLIIPPIWMILDSFYTVNYLITISAALFMFGIYQILTERSLLLGVIAIFLSSAPLVVFFLSKFKFKRVEREKYEDKPTPESKEVEKSQPDKVYYDDVPKTGEDVETILEKLKEFGIKGDIVNKAVGPVLTVYEFVPAPGVRVQSISKLEDDLFVRLKKPIRIVAPLPNGNIGFEIPNNERKFYDLQDFEEEIYKGENLDIPIGVDTLGNPFHINISSAPHILIGGATGSGKSVLLTTMILALIKKNSPEDLNLILIDPKRVELSVFEGLPHLILPVAKTVKDAVYALKTAVKIMDERYAMMSAIGARDITSFNEKVEKFDMDKMPYMVIVIDELADLMMLSPKETSEYIQRITQLARAVGIHMIAATQRPSVDVITGVIKANFPTRIALKVTSRFDSRTILDTEGAERLLGKGDMLILMSDRPEPVRVHGFYTSHKSAIKVLIEYAASKLSNLWGIDEIKLKEFLQTAYEEGTFTAIFRDDEPAYDERMYRLCSLAKELLGISEEEFKNKLVDTAENYYPYRFVEEEETEENEINKVDKKILDAARVCQEIGYGSASLIQRKLGVGFPRAAKIIDQLEKLGFLSPPEGPKPRKVLMSVDELERKLKERGFQV